MMCLFDSLSTNATTNEEYRAVLDKRIRLLVVMLFLGILTIGFIVINELIGFLPTNDSWLLGVYSGIGAGLIGVSVVKIIQMKRISNDEELLKKERLKNMDERNRLIAGKAVQTAAITVVIISYVVMLVSAFYSKLIFYCFWWIAIIFLLSYLLFYKIYQKKL